jgi:hypothetical protein
MYQSDDHITAITVIFLTAEYAEFVAEEREP